MRIFSVLYERAMRWAAHRHAPRYLAGLSFAESSFFPIPPDVMLAPMTLARPDRGWLFAAITTVASVAGGVLGYFIGWLAIEALEPWMVRVGYDEAYLLARDWFDRWGFWAVLAAGFSPIPYKVFTIAAGAMLMFLPGFVLASLLGRGARFFLVAGLIVWGGAPMERAIRRHVDTLGWVCVVLLVAGYFWLQA
ncbi:MAG: DedA family protein [Gammaproteobacteria bacterium]|nr:DedA family protein [Gammaproteobacteria bacterium]